MLFTAYYLMESLTEFPPVETKRNVANVTQAPKITIKLSDLFNTFKPVQPIKLFKCDYCLKLYRNEHNLNIHRETCRK